MWDQHEDTTTGRVVCHTLGHVDQRQQSAEEVQRLLRADGYRRVRIVERYTKVFGLMIKHRFVVADPPAAK